MAQVVILHGWSDTSKSFEPLAEFLKASGHVPVPVWLGDYVSMEDDVVVADVAKRLEQELVKLVAAGDLAEPFDMIVHSTGGLVAREWIATWNRDGRRPVRRLIMLAPANFGSALAAKGKSLLGRVVKGWDHWFHTGRAMLDSLELSSPYQWRLARRDLFGAAGADSPYGADRVLPFVIVGSHPYPGTLQQITNEDGSDGTVRVAGANLNSLGLTVDFAADEENPVLTPWTTRHDFEFPLAVLPARTHASIIDPEDGDVATGPGYDDPLGTMILEALACPDFAAYQAIAADWAAVSQETATLAHDDIRRKELLPEDEDAAADFFRQYMQVNVHVTDDSGAEVTDYFLEFFGAKGVHSDPATVFFHSEVIEKVSVNTANASYRCLYLDRTALMTGYYRNPAFFPDPSKGVVLMSISAAPPGDNVQYFHRYQTGAAGWLELHSEDKARRWLKRSTTHFLEIRIPRVPKAKVFRMRAV